jgi:hypothetical protein
VRLGVFKMDEKAGVKERLEEATRFPGGSEELPAWLSPEFPESEGPPKSIRLSENFRESPESLISWDWERWKVVGFV